MSRPNLQEIKNWKKNIRAYTCSNFFIKQKNVTTSGNMYWAAGCYGSLFNGRAWEEVAVYVFPHQKYEKGSRTYLSWLINDSHLAPIFLTKDVEKGFTEGFDIDLNQPSNYALMGMIAMRSVTTNPFRSEMFEKYVGDDLTAEDAYLIGEKTMQYSDGSFNLCLGPHHESSIHPCFLYSDFKKGGLRYQLPPMNKECTLRPSPRVGASGFSSLVNFDLILSQDAQKKVFAEVTKGKAKTVTKGFSTIVGVVHPSMDIITDLVEYMHNDAL